MGMQQMVQHQRGMDFVHNVAPAMTAPGTRFELQGCRLHGACRIQAAAGGAAAAIN